MMSARRQLPQIRGAGVEYDPAQIVVLTHALDRAVERLPGLRTAPRNAARAEVVRMVAEGLRQKQVHTAFPRQFHARGERRRNVPVGQRLVTFGPDTAFVIDIGAAPRVLVVTMMTRLARSY